MIQAEDPVERGDSAVQDLQQPHPDPNLLAQEPTLDQGGATGHSGVGELGAQAADVDVHGLAVEVEHPGEAVHVEPAALVLGELGLGEALSGEGEQEIMRRPRLPAVLPGGGDHGQRHALFVAAHQKVNAQAGL